MPLTLALASGKDSYARVYEDLFGRPPAVRELKLPEARPLPILPEAAPRKKPRTRDRNSPPRHQDSKIVPDGVSPRPLGDPGVPGGSTSASEKKGRPKKTGGDN
jgi:hypothetical protein